MASSYLTASALAASARFAPRTALRIPPCTRAHTRIKIPSTLHAVRFMSSQQKSYEYILVSRPEPSVVLVTLNRPKALNALCSPLFQELNEVLKEADEDDTVGAMVLTGSERAFAGMQQFYCYGPGKYSS